MKTWTEQELRDLILTNDIVMMRALIALYNEQTNDEQSDGYTKYRNGRGFNGADAKFLTSIVQFYFKRKYLSDKQKAVVRRKILKYTKQLTEIANEKEAMKG